MSGHGGQRGRAMLALYGSCASLALWRLLNELAFEQVIPMCLQMIEHFLEIRDAPRIRETQRLQCLDKNPFCVRREGWNVIAGQIAREGKNIRLALIPKQKDAQCSPKVYANTLLCVSKEQRLSSEIVPGGCPSSES
jgi:hypothetical protein